MADQVDGAAACSEGVQRGRRGFERVAVEGAEPRARSREERNVSPPESELGALVRPVYASRLMLVR